LQKHSEKKYIVLYEELLENYHIGFKCCSLYAVSLFDVELHNTYCSYSTDLTFSRIYL